MKLEMRRALNSNGSNHYLLLDGTKISRNGGWCLDGVYAIFGQMFNFNTNDGRNVEVIYTDEGVTWKLQERKKEIEYPIYAKVNDSEAIYVFTDKEAKGLCIKGGNDSFDTVGKIIGNAKYESIFFDRYGYDYWKIIPEEEVFKTRWGGTW